MTLRPCYRATCDAPGCTSAEYLPHERSGPACLHLTSIGWTTIEYYIEASGAARLAYACPIHRDWKPSDDGRRLVGMSMRDRRWLRIRRASMLWMLCETGADSATPAGHIGLSESRVVELARMYDDLTERRRRESRDWIEPWAKRLRAAGAIP